MYIHQLMLTNSNFSNYHIFINNVSSNIRTSRINNKLVFVRKSSLKEIFKILLLWGQEPIRMTSLFLADHRYPPPPWLWFVKYTVVILSAGQSIGFYYLTTHYLYSLGKFLIFSVLQVFHLQKWMAKRLSFSVSCYKD